MSEEIPLDPKDAFEHMLLGGQIRHGQCLFMLKSKQVYLKSEHKFWIPIDFDLTRLLKGKWYKG